MEKLKPLEVELRRLEDLSESIVNDFAYMKKREEEMRDTNGKRLLLQKNGVLRPLTSPECVIRTAFGDQAILVVSACPVPNIENLLIFLSLKQSLVCPSSRSNLFLSPFLV